MGKAALWAGSFAACFPCSERGAVEIPALLTGFEFQELEVPLEQERGKEGGEGDRKGEACPHFYFSFWPPRDSENIIIMAVCSFSEPTLPLTYPRGLL